MQDRVRHLGVASGVGLVIANMIGSGVFVSAGFMAQEMGPGPLLLAWVVGAILALAGTRAYAAVAMLVPRSGGEYRYLADLVHPALGTMAGWAALLLGFSAPIAINALAAARFLGTLLPIPGDRIVPAAMIVGMVAVHAVDLSLSRRTQNALAVAKIALVVAFVALGLIAGSHALPRWTPPRASAGFPLKPFAIGLFYIAYALSGWNAAIYSAEEFRRPARDVPRALLIGCTAVAALYLLVNLVFVTNLPPGRSALVTEGRAVTLAHVVAEDLIGARGAAVVSALAVVTFLSTMSAMVFAGPRVCAAMARDGFLPAGLRGRPGRPPAASVVLQGALALAFLFLNELHEMLRNVGALLTFFSALTVSSLFWVRLRRRDLPRPPRSSLVAAAIYVGSAAWMLHVGLRGSGILLLWLAGLAAIALAACAAKRLTSREERSREEREGDPDVTRQAASRRTWT